VPAPKAIPAGRLARGDFAAGCAPDRLVYFLLNVGDGDTQLILLSEHGGVRSLLVVDVATTRRLPALIAELQAHAVLPAEQPTFGLVVATHPQSDHIGGMPEFLNTYFEGITEFWDSGLYYTTQSYFDMMGAIKALAIPYAQPTSGMTRWIGNVKDEALSPSIRLRNTSRDDRRDRALDGPPAGLEVRRQTGGHDRPRSGPPVHVSSNRPR
jgi:competence protein ComEC